MYSQYLREREYYNSSSTPISHISFPNSHNNPSAPQLSDPDIRMHAFGDRTELPTISRQSSSGVDQRILNEINDNQVDSGHPSLENSASPNDTQPSSITHTPVTSANSKDDGVVSNGEVGSGSGGDDESQSTPTNAIIKSNPFVVNGMTRGPNKVILEPIEHPIRGGGGGGGYVTGDDIPTVSSVPKHLFTIRKRNQD